MKENISSKKSSATSPHDLKRLIEKVLKISLETRADLKKTSKRLESKIDEARNDAREQIQTVNLALTKRLVRVENEVHFTQRALKATKDELSSDIRDVKVEMGLMKEEMGSMKEEIKSVETRLASKIDSLGERLENHEERIIALETVTPPPSPPHEV